MNRAKAPAPSGRRDSARKAAKRKAPKVKPKAIPEHGVNLSDLTDAALEQLIEDSIAEMGSRRLQNVDPEALINEGFELCFRDGAVIGPKILNGYVLVPGSYSEKSGGNHDCHLFTIRESDESSYEWWAWDDDTGRMVDSRTIYDGKLRKTVSLYLATPGLMVIGHNRRSRYEPRFSRNVHKYVKSGITAFQVTADGEEPRLIRVSADRSRPLPRPNSLSD